MCGSGRAARPLVSSVCLWTLEREFASMPFASNAPSPPDEVHDSSGIDATETEPAAASSASRTIPDILRGLSTRTVSALAKAVNVAMEVLSEPSRPSSKAREDLSQQYVRMSAGAAASPRGAAVDWLWTLPGLTARTREVDANRGWFDDDVYTRCYRQAPCLLAYPARCRQGARDGQWLACVCHRERTARGGGRAATGRRGWRATVTRAPFRPDQGSDRPRTRRAAISA